jgi:hypothetical protein
VLNTTCWHALLLLLLLLQTQTGSPPLRCSVVGGSFLAPHLPAYHRA